MPKNPDTTTVALVMFDGGGNIPPFVAIGRELTARGHRVVLIGQPQQQRVADAEGFGFLPLEKAAFWNSGVRRSVPSAVRQAVGLLSSRELGAEIAAQVSASGADLAIVDCLLTSGLHELRQAGVPAIVLFHTLVTYWHGSLARGPVGLLSRLRGTDPMREWARAAGRVATCERSMDPVVDSAIEWVGSIESGRERARTGGEPLVLVSLSTAWLPGQTDAYQRIIDALAGLPVRVVVTLGGIAPDRPLRAPAGIEIVERADHAALLPEVSLVVGHGGHSTTMRALAHGIPLVLMPMHPLLDEPAVAAAAQRLGVGAVVSRKASAQRIRTAVERILADDEAARAAEDLGARLRATDAARAAADAVQSLLGNQVDARTGVSPRMRDR